MAGNILATKFRFGVVGFICGQQERIAYARDYLRTRPEVVAQVSQLLTGQLRIPNVSNRSVQMPDKYLYVSLATVMLEAGLIMRLHDIATKPQTDKPQKGNDPFEFMGKSLARDVKCSNWSMEFLGIERPKSFDLLKSTDAVTQTMASFGIRHLQDGAPDQGFLSYRTDSQMRVSVINHPEQQTTMSELLLRVIRLNKDLAGLTAKTDNYFGENVQ